MDIKIIISMFEELKKQTSEQFSNLSKLIESKTQQPSSRSICQHWNRHQQRQTH